MLYRDSGIENGGYSIIEFRDWGQDSAIREFRV